MPKARYKICTEEKCRKPRFHGSLCEAHYTAARAKAAAAKAPAAAAPRRRGTGWRLSTQRALSTSGR